MVKPGITSIKDLKGKTVAASVPGTSLDRVLPLSHPRHYSVKTSPEFSAVKAELTEAVRTEVLAAQAQMV